MAKKLLILAMAAVMMLGVLGLTACYNISLEEYKATAKAMIQTRANSKAQDDYTSYRWEEILHAVEKGKTKINIAMNKNDVDAVRIAVEQTIDAVQTKEEEVAELLKYFDLTDPKEIWDGSFNRIQFEPIIPGVFDIGILIYFRQLKEGALFPEITEHHLNLLNLFEIEKCSVNPPEIVQEYIECGIITRGIATLYLTDISPETFTIVIRHLESLDFIKSASPENFVPLW